MRNCKMRGTPAAQSHPQPFQTVLRSILAEVEAANDDAHAWQVALSHLAQPPLTQAQNEWIHAARTSISESIRRQHNHYMLMQWVDDDVSRMTARLLAAKDQGQVIDILNDELPLAASLPAVSIQQAQIALLEPERQVAHGNQPHLPGQGYSLKSSFMRLVFPPPAWATPSRFRWRCCRWRLKTLKPCPDTSSWRWQISPPYAAFIVCRT